MTTGSNTGYIGANLMVHGRLSGKGEMRIDGQFDGDLSIHGLVQIGQDARVRAHVEATVVEVAGQLKGNVSADDEVRVCEGGELLGDVRAPMVSIEDGGQLIGGIEMEVDLPNAVLSEADGTGDTTSTGRERGPGAAAEAGDGWREV